MKDSDMVQDMDGLSTACRSVLHNRGVNTVGQLRGLAYGDPPGILRLPGIGRVFHAQIVAALDGNPIAGDHMHNHSPAQLRALATITEVTGKPSSSWRIVGTPPDMTWVDYVDETGKVGQCCRNGDGWRQAPTGEKPVFLVYSVRTTR